MLSILENPKAKAAAGAVGLAVALGFGGGLKFMKNQDRQAEALARIEARTNRIEDALYRVPAIREQFEIMAQEARAKKAVYNP